MAEMNRGSRPLSPHLSIYRPQLTSISSILVRITGNVLIVGAAFGRLVAVGGRDVSDTLLSLTVC